MEWFHSQTDMSLSPDFPYHFNQDGQLCHRDTREPFVFCYKRDDVKRMQQEQQVLSRYIALYVYNLLESQCHLQRFFLPVQQPDVRHKNLVFASSNVLEGPGTLVVLLQDKGTMRCGQWSWRVIARQGLEKGSQLPYITRALEEAWEVLLMNPNESGSPEEHASLVWDLLISRCAAKSIAMVAHGYGGVAFVDLLTRRPREVQQRVCAVAFVDSFHSPWHQPLDPGSRDWLKAKSRKWVLSTKPLNRPVGSLKAECPQLSAGTQCHELAPGACVESVFRFFAKTLKNKPPPVPFDMVTRSKSQASSCQLTAR